MEKLEVSFGCITNGGAVRIHDAVKVVLGKIEINGGRYYREICVVTRDGQKIVIDLFAPVESGVKVTQSKKRFPSNYVKAKE